MQGVIRTHIGFPETLLVGLQVFNEPVRRSDFPARDARLLGHDSPDSWRDFEYRDLPFHQIGFHVHDLVLPVPVGYVTSLDIVPSLWLHVSCSDTTTVQEPRDDRRSHRPHRIPPSPDLREHGVELSPDDSRVRDYEAVEALKCLAESLELADLEVPANHEHVLIYEHVITSEAMGSWI